MFGLYNKLSEFAELLEWKENFNHKIHILSSLQANCDSKSTERIKVVSFYDKIIWSECQIVACTSSLSLFLRAS